LKFETLIIGSGYYSLGYASTHSRTLITEETQLLDPHFGGTLSGFMMKTQIPADGGARKLYDAFVKEELIGDGKLSVSELEGALCRFAQKDMPNILLGSFCTKITRLAGGYEVEVCNNSGVTVVHVDKIIDTRVPAGDKINLLVALKDKQLPDIETVSPAFYDDQCVVSFKLEQGSNINRAKSQAVKKYLGALLAVGARIADVSYRTYGAELFERFVDANGILHVDERAFDDIFAAYGKGETEI
jgi:hypothetical protein